MSVSVPPRHYDLAARILAMAVERSSLDGNPIAETLADAASAAGRDLARGSDCLMDVLQRNDFRPHVTEDDRVLLGNCPFHRLAGEHPRTVCTLNLNLLRGAAAACGEPDVDLSLEPAPGRCCVALRGLTGPVAEFAE
jgi:predicted ArsR family transcriptional regulator